MRSPPPPAGEIPITGVIYLIKQFPPSRSKTAPQRSSARSASAGRLLCPRCSITPFLPSAPSIGWRPLPFFTWPWPLNMKRIRGADNALRSAPLFTKFRASLTVPGRPPVCSWFSTLPFCRSELDEAWSFAQFNVALFWPTGGSNCCAIKSFLFRTILSIARESNPSLDRLFHVVLSFHNSRAYRSRDTSVAFAGQWHYAGHQAEQLCIHLNNIEDERRFSVESRLSHPAVYRKGHCRQLHFYLTDILALRSSHRPTNPSGSSFFSGRRKKKKVLYTFNGTDAPTERIDPSGTVWNGLPRPIPPVRPSSRTVCRTPTASWPTKRV